MYLYVNSYIPQGFHSLAPNRRNHRRDVYPIPRTVAAVGICKRSACGVAVTQRVYRRHPHTIGNVTSAWFGRNTSRGWAVNAVNGCFLDAVSYEKICSGGFAHYPHTIGDATFAWFGLNPSGGRGCRFC
jgi:hypothetical protein